MKRRLTNIALVVADYDEAIDYYTRVLGFSLLEDEDRGGGKRWVRVSPGGDCSLLLARAVGEEQQSRIGNQTGGRVFLFLETDDFDRDYARFSAGGVHFVEEPRDEDYGRVVVFEDRYGNRWDLIQSKA